MMGKGSRLLESSISRALMDESRSRDGIKPNARGSLEMIVRRAIGLGARKTDGERGSTPNDCWRMR